MFRYFIIQQSHHFTLLLHYFCKWQSTKGNSVVEFAFSDLKLSQRRFKNWMIYFHSEAAFTHNNSRVFCIAVFKKAYLGSPIKISSYKITSNNHASGMCKRGLKKIRTGQRLAKQEQLKMPIQNVHNSEILIQIRTVLNCYGSFRKVFLL